MSSANGTGVARFIRDAAGTCADGEPDSELVRRFAVNADEKAFRALVARHGPVVWAVCRRMLWNHHDAEDAFQATFLVLARGAGGIRSSTVVGGWLCGVAARVSARVRSLHRLEHAEVEPSVGHLDGALGELTVREAEAALYEELARLPEKYRAPLVLCCLEGLSRDEAAGRLGLTENQVKHGLEQGREQLRIRLNGRGIALGLALLTNLLSAPAGAVPLPLAEAAVCHATGASPPAAVTTLAHGVNRAMWFSKWKWAIAASATLALTAGGSLAAVLLQVNETPAATAKAGPNLVLVGTPAQSQPKIAVVNVKEQQQPWEIAARFLQLVIDNKGEQALKLADPKALTERHVKEIQVAGLKRAKPAMILINDKQVMVVTERAKLKRSPNADATDEHAIVTLGRDKPDAPWLVRDSDIGDEAKVVRELGRYLDGKFNFDPPAKSEPIKDTKTPWDVATEFMTFALADKTEDALKLSVPGTISENKLGEIKKGGFTSADFAVVLLNDTRIEVATKQRLRLKGADSAESHLVLMLTKSKDGAWQVKDIDARGEEELRPRVEMYLGGSYDEKPK